LIKKSENFFETIIPYKSAPISFFRLFMLRLHSPSFFAKMSAIETDFQLALAPSCKKTEQL